MAEVTLAVDGVVYSGWQSLQVTREIERAETAFALQVSERWSGIAAPRPIRPGSVCSLALDGEEVVRGYVDRVETTYDTAQHRIAVTGRCPVGDLIDCAAVVDGEHEFSGLGLAQVASRLARPFGVAVRVEVDLGPAFDRFAIQPGETAWAAIERACRFRGVLATSDGVGSLVLTRGGAGGRGAGDLVLGENVLSATGSFDHSQRFSLTVVRGQSEGLEWEGLEDIAAAEARITDPDVKRWRPQVVVAESAGGGPGFADRAHWQMRVARGRSRQVRMKVAGWRGAGGQLWRPNTLVRVRDRYLGVDADLLVAGVDYRLGREGSITELTLAPPDAFDLLPEPEPDEADDLWGLS